MKPATFGVAVCLISTAAQGQYWKALGRGTIGPNEIQTLFSDSASDRLLAGGTFRWIMNDEDTVLGMGHAAWNGVRWDSVATRIQLFESGSSQQTYWFLRFQGTLYACGTFSVPLANGSFSRYFAKLNETTQRWDTLACSVSTESSVTTLVPKQPDSVLHATGHRYGLCGEPESCVFEYDGTAFQKWAPFDLIPDPNDNYVGFVFHYKGKVYMTGLFGDPMDPDDVVTFLRWNGTSWEYVPGWGTYYAPIKEILVKDDILYVAGGLNMALGGPGNGVASFDGETWNNLGGGVIDADMPGSTAVLGLQWFHDELVVCGHFTHCGGMPTSSIAKWNGQQWCSYPGDIRAKWGNHATLYEMAVWRDSLYVCGAINTVDGDTMRQVIQWLGGDAVAGCSTVGVPEPTATTPTLHVATLPVPGQWRITLPFSAPWTLIAFNTAGQAVGRWQITGSTATVDLGEASSGLFLLQAVSPSGLRLATKLIRP